MVGMHCCCKATLLYYLVTWPHIEAPKDEEVQLARPATWLVIVPYFLCVCPVRSTASMQQIWVSVPI